MSNPELRAEFIKELKALFEKYGASMDVSDEWTGYSECGSDIHARIDVPTVYSEGYTEVLREGFDVDLGTYFDKDKEL